MATEEEIQRLVVRLIGDDSPYRDTLKSSGALAEQWHIEIDQAMIRSSDKMDALFKTTQSKIEATIAKAPQNMNAIIDNINAQFFKGADAINKGLMRDLKAVEVHMRRVEAAAAGSRARMRAGMVRGLKLGLGFAGLSGALGFMKLFTGSWKMVVQEVSNAGEAAKLYSAAQIESVSGAIASVGKLRAEWKQWQRDLGATVAPAVDSVSSGLAKAMESFRTGRDQIAGFLGGGWEGMRGVANEQARAAQRRKNNVLNAEELKEREHREKTIEKAMEREREAMESLNVKLGNVSEAQHAVNQLMKEAGESAQKIGAQHTDALKALVEQRLELEKQLKAREDARRAAEAAAQEEKQQIEETNRIRARENATRMKEAEKRQNADMEQIKAQALINIERGQLEKQMQEIMASGVPISAGAAIEAGTVEARSATKFGTAQETMNQVLRQLEALEKQQLNLQERATKGIEAIRDNATLTVTIA